MSRRSDSALEGILLIDKPAGWTSHDVVAKARRITGQRRIGHTGTLDPMATGLLVLCLGRATRLVEYMTGHAKRYTGIVALGRTTTTDDAEGETLAESAVPQLDGDRVEHALSLFRGPIQQRPPAFSALKLQGKRAYQLARAGAAPVLSERPVTIHALLGRVTSRDAIAIAIEVECSAGTYIRSLARDLGEELGCGAHLAALRRTRAGNFDVADAVTLDELQTRIDSDTLSEILLPPDEGILDIDAAILGEAGCASLANGVPWPCSDAGAVRDTLRIYDAGGDFVGVGSLSESGEIRASKVFAAPKSAL